MQAGFGCAEMSEPQSGRTNLETRMPQSETWLTCSLQAAQTGWAVRLRVVGSLPVGACLNSLLFLWKQKSRDEQQVSDDVCRLFLNCLSKQMAGNAFADEAAAQQEAHLPGLQHMSQHEKEERLNSGGMTSGSERSQGLLLSSCWDCSAEWRWPAAGNGSHQQISCTALINSDPFLMLFLIASRHWSVSISKKGLIIEYYKEINTWSEFMDKTQLKRMLKDPLPWKSCFWCFYQAGSFFCRWRTKKGNVT